MIARGPTNHRIGASHGRAAADDTLVRQARALREQGLSYAAIGRQLGIHWRTVCDWVNYATRWSA